MKIFNQPDAYRFDELGNLVVDQAESEEQRLAVEATVLYKEGMSANHPADIAEHNAAEGGATEPPPELDPTENETPEETRTREEYNKRLRDKWTGRQREEDRLTREREEMAQQPQYGQSGFGAPPSTRPGNIETDENRAQSNQAFGLNVDKDRSEDTDPDEREDADEAESPREKRERERQERMKRQRR